MCPQPRATEVFVCLVTMAKGVGFQTTEATPFPPSQEDMDAVVWGGGGGTWAKEHGPDLCATGRTSGGLVGGLGGASTASGTFGTTPRAPGGIYGP